MYIEFSYSFLYIYYFLFICISSFYPYSFLEQIYSYLIFASVPYSALFWVTVFSLSHCLILSQKSLFSWIRWYDITYWLHFICIFCKYLFPCVSYIISYRTYFISSACLLISAYLSNGYHKQVWYLFVQCGKWGLF